MRPVIRKRRPKRIRAMTWNVHHGSTFEDLAPDVERFFKLGTQVFLLQEMKRHKGAVRAFRQVPQLGIRWVAPEFAIAWDKRRFRYVRHRRVEMSQKEYWSKSRSIIVVLWDKQEKRQVKCMSYHPPAHVQRKNHWKWPNVRPALRDTDRTWDRIARNSRIPCLFGGDDNVDEFRGITKPFKFMLHGMLQVRANKPTHGKRRIDDFRVKGLKPIWRSRRVFNTKSDHHAFMCDFKYRRTA